MEHFLLPNSNAMSHSDDELSDDEHDDKPSAKEEFDADGNVVQVGNLFFLPGALGKGAFGTVRLARRKLPSSDHSTGEHVRLRHSISTPTGTNERSRMDIFMSPPQPPNDGHPTPQSPAASRRRRTSSDMQPQSSSENDVGEELVAVKIFSKSVLKRCRTMKRNKKSRRVKIQTALQLVEREIAVMKKLSHPNLVNLYEVIDSPQSDMLYMVLDYMTLGEILTYQNDGTFRRKDPRPGSTKCQVPGLVNGHFTEEQAELYFVDILHGLAYLHLHHICKYIFPCRLICHASSMTNSLFRNCGTLGHRDLKPENILIDSRGIAKLADFGVSHVFKEKTDAAVHRQVSLGNNATLSDVESDYSGDDDDEDEVDVNDIGSTDSPPHPRDRLTRKDADQALAMKGMANDGKLTKTVGTWCFWSPAMCEGNRAFSGYAGDIWAAGVCLYIFVTGKLPFYSEFPCVLFEKIRTAPADYSDYGLSNALVDLIEKCLEKESDRRAGVGDCLKHPALQVAREKRFKQLCAELDQSEKKVNLTDDDVRAAFRMVKGVPKEIIRSATKTIHTRAKKLHEGLSEARDRLGHHGRSTPPVDEVHHHGFFRAKIGSSVSSGHSSASESGRDPGHRNGFFHQRRLSHGSMSKSSMPDIDESTTQALTLDTLVTTRKPGMSCTVSSLGSVASHDDLEDDDHISEEGRDVLSQHASYPSSINIKERPAATTTMGKICERKVSFNIPDEADMKLTRTSSKMRRKRGKCVVM